MRGNGSSRGRSLVGVLFGDRLLSWHVDGLYYDFRKEPEIGVAAGKDVRVAGRCLGWLLGGVESVDA